MVMINDTWSFSLIPYCIRYFYLTNGASRILISNEGFILINSNTVSLFKVSAVVIVGAFGPEAALVVAQARFTLALVAVKVLSWLLFAACWTSFSIHRYAPCE
jgi:hypothetical protein